MISENSFNDQLEAIDAVQELSNYQRKVDCQILFEALYQGVKEDQIEYFSRIMSGFLLALNLVLGKEKAINRTIISQTSTPVLIMVFTGDNHYKEFNPLKQLIMNLVTHTYSKIYKVNSNLMHIMELLTSFKGFDQIIQKLKSIQNEKNLPVKEPYTYGLGHVKKGRKGPKAIRKSIQKMLNYRVGRGSSQMPITIEGQSEGESDIEIDLSEQDDFEIHL